VELKLSRKLKNLVDNVGLWRKKNPFKNNSRKINNKKRGTKSNVTI